jgi:hypothetical protein
MRRSVCVLAGVLSGVLTVGGVVPAVAVAPSGSVGAAVGEQVEFVLDRQLPSGAIQKTGGFIDPYSANVAVLGLLGVGTDRTRSAVLGWMRWNLTHLNVGAGEVDGLEYTVSSWDVVDGVEVERSPSSADPLPYDSVDKTAASTLEVAWAAYQSGDPTLRDFVRDNVGTYEAIANLLTYGAPGGVRMSDGLTRRFGRDSVEYTTHNAEAYAGLWALGALEVALGRASTDYNYYDIWAGTTKNAILEQLWDPSRQEWDTAKGVMGDDSFVQTGLSNVAPSLFGITEHAERSWDVVDAAWPLWAAGETATCEPHTAIAVAAERSGRVDAARQLLAATAAQYASDGWSYPVQCPAGTDRGFGYWHSGEAGWFLIAATEIGEAGQEDFTWSTATHPAGSAKDELNRGTIGGGVWRHNGWYYTPSVAHVVTALGNTDREHITGNGVVGRTAYRAPKVAAADADPALIATGTAPVAPLIRTGTDTHTGRDRVAAVSAVGSPDALRRGAEVCQSGTSDQTRARGGFLCGTITADCLRTDRLCGFQNGTGAVYLGDSGGPVWASNPDGTATLLGWVTSSSSGGTIGRFVPVWVLQDQDWTPKQTWSPGETDIPPFPAGQQADGCFVTTTGCVRI